MKKICLMIIPSTFLINEKVFPFLGILKVASAWEALGAKIDVLDLSGYSNYLEIVKEYTESNHKDLEFIGITATTPQIVKAYEIADYIKKQWSVKLVLGGTHGTAMHTAMKRELKNNIVNGRAFKDVEKLKSIFDIIVCGEGELTLEIIRNTAKGVIDADDRKSQFFLTDKTFSELPPPARHFIDLDSYYYHIDDERATSLISQLGCAFKCSFCSMRNSPSMRITRNRSVSSIIEELESIYIQYGYKGYMFYDDELNLSKTVVDLMHAISDLANKYGVNFKCRGFTKSELFNDIQAKAMYEAGFRILLTGFESGSERILKTIQKNATRDDNTKCVETAKRHGMKVKALMSLGHAGESYETIEETRKWLLEVEPEFIDLTVITCMPGSPYFDDGIYDKEKDCYIYTSPKTGDKLYQKNLDYTKESDYYKGQIGNYISYVWTDYLSASELVKIRDEIEVDVKKKLNIAPEPAGEIKTYQHSMGQGNIPDSILRSSETHKAPEMPKEDKKRLKLAL